MPVTATSIQPIEQLSQVAGLSPAQTQSWWQAYQSVIQSFISRHRLPASFEKVIVQVYLPLANWLVVQRGQCNQPMIIGVNGGQGSGKSTLTDFMLRFLPLISDYRVAGVSIDDFYLTKAEREQRARLVHPLLATRGVPGTHDSDRIGQLFHFVRQATSGEMAVPRFDKAVDDRLPQHQWLTLQAPLDILFLEGWCVGVPAQSQAALTEPINELERGEDPDGTWRSYVNQQLIEHYEPLWQQLDRLIFLAVPGFEQVLEWRTEQEQKLQQGLDSTAAATGVMSPQEIRRFVKFYERLTRVALNELPKQSDWVLHLDRHHQFYGYEYNVES